MNIFVILVIAPLAFATEEDPCLIKTSDGTYKGCEKKTLNGTKVCCYNCIKYGSAEVFGEPIPATSNTTSNETINNEACPMCYQISNDFSPDQMSHDCLYLHVHVPQNCSGLLPVLFYIHGGGFTKGMAPGLYETEVNQLLSENCIVVACNYRLGPYGFMSTGTCNCQGNGGLKDIILALEWTGENIVKFGGDKNNVKVMGFSAGAACAGALPLCTKAKGLFDGLILESGAPACDWAYSSPEVARTNAHNLGEKVGCDPTLTSSSMCDCMKTIDPMFLLNKAEEMLTLDDLLHCKMCLWQLTSENQTCKNCLLTESIISLMSKPPACGPINIIMGCAKAEFEFFKPTILAPLKDWLSLFSQVIFRSCGCVAGTTNPYCMNAIGNELNSFYCKNGPSCTIDDISTIFSYTQFVLPMTCMAQYFASYKCNVYFYEFCHKGPCSAGAMVNATNSTHGEMYPCCYPTDETVACNAFFKDEDTEYCTKTLLECYASFIHDGRPKVESISLEPFSVSNPAYFRIDKSCEMRTCMQNEEAALWKSVLSKSFLNQRCSSCPKEFIPTPSCK